MKLNFWKLLFTLYISLPLIFLFHAGWLLYLNEPTLIINIPAYVIPWAIMGSIFKYVTIFWVLTLDWDKLKQKIKEAKNDQ